MPISLIDKLCLQFCKWFACKSESDCNSNCKSKCFAGPKKILFKICSSEQLNG